MAKKTDGQPDELPGKVEDWKAPWEVDKDGEDVAEEDQKLDAARLKRYLFGLLKDKARFRTQVNELTTNNTALEEQIAAADDPEKVKKLQADLVKAQKERDDAKSGAGLEVIKLRVALEKGLTARQAKRLQGTTEEEIEADADEILEDFGTVTHETVDETEETEDKSTARTTPKRVIKPTVGPKTKEEKPEKEIDYDKWAQEYAASRGR